MITREQVADLRPGDVVEMSWTERDATVSIRGALASGRGQLLLVGNYWVREEDGSPIQGLQDGGKRTFAVVSRAPRPLYVNHPRAKPVRLDVVCDADAPGEAAWISAGHTTDGDQLWVDADAAWCYRADLPARLRLLVDGETGQVVQ